MKLKWNVSKKYFFTKLLNSLKIRKTYKPDDAIQSKENSDTSIMKSPLNTSILSTAHNDLQINSTNQLDKLQKKDLINKKYELYKDYEPMELLKKDKEFGEVIKYSDFLDEGKEKFENVLTKYMEENRHLEKNKEYKQLIQIVDEKQKMFFSEYKEEHKYTLKPYEERWYKEAIYSRKTSDLDSFFKKEDPMKKRAPKLVNKKEKARKLEDKAYEPDHPTYLTAVKTPYETYTDNFQWLCNLDSPETKKFLEFELLYSQHCLYKYSGLEDTILEGIHDNICISNSVPVQISNSNYIFKREKTDLSLFRMDANLISPEMRGSISIEDLKAKDIAYEEIFGLNDFIELNTRFTDLNFLEFAKRLLDGIETDQAMLVDFCLCPKEQFLVLFFDMTGLQNGYDIIIKDIKNNVLLPIVIFNSDGSVAFDHHDGLFYSQMDITGRTSAVFRHQIGKSRNADIQIYNEKSKDFKVKTFNCNSKEMVYIEISSLDKGGVPVNEIWFKPANDLDKMDFSLVKKMQKNVNYSVKYFNGAFYILTNKSDTYDKFLESIRVSDRKVSGLLEHSRVDLKNNPSNKDLIIKKEISLLDIYNTESSIIDSIQENNALLPVKRDLISLNENINIISYEIFKNYLVVHEEVDKKSRFKIFNLLTDTKYIHEPDSPYIEITMIDNLAFNSNYFRYLTSSLINSHETVDFSLGTRKSYLIHKNEYIKYNETKYNMELIHIEDREKEVKIPVLLFYKTEMYSSNSPFILFSKGAEMSKKDLEFKETYQCLLDKGFVLAVPQVRGTKFFDFDWYQSGIAENKMKHFTDFLDVAFYLKESGMTEKVIIYGEGPSGGVDAAVSFMQYPDFFDSVILYNGAMDILDYCQTNRSIDVIEEFGDITVKQFYEMMKIYSPYHTVSPGLHCPILIASDETTMMHHSLKFTGKLRKKNKQDGKRNVKIAGIDSLLKSEYDTNLQTKGKNKIYFELLSSRLTQQEKHAFMFSFIIGNTYLN